MGIDTWQEWLTRTMYDLAQVFFLLGAFVLARATRQISAYLCVIGFAAFLGGNILMIEASKGIVEAEQTNREFTRVKQYQSIGRFLSSTGFLVAGSGLFLFALARRNAGKFRESHGVSPRSNNQ